MCWEHRPGIRKARKSQKVKHGLSRIVYQDAAGIYNVINRGITDFLIQPERLYSCLEIEVR